MHVNNTPLEGSRRRWEDNIKMYVTEVGCKGVKWIQVAVGRVTL